MAPWPTTAEPGLTVAVMGSDPDNFDVVVLKAQGDGWKVIATTNTNNDPEIDSVDAAVLADLAPDLIPYRISKDEVAFGVRAITDFNSMSTAIGNTSLHLFRLHDGQLDEIFAADVDTNECDKTSPNNDCSKANLFFNSHQSSMAVITISC